MTLANRITLMRMFLSLLIFALIFNRGFWSVIAAFILLTVASISDYLDGAIARHTHTTTRFGAIVDPLADKILILATFLAFASIRELTIPLWAVFIILLREFTISTLRVLAALHGEAMKAEAAGKLKTAVQLTSAFIILALLVLKAWLRKNPVDAHWLTGLAGSSGRIAHDLTVLTALVTLISGLIYIYHHRELIRKSWSEKKT
ncbi:MAG: CDP-diacylglycerol--glycerol-3-phosphate 3-phosphatidyltransferase [Elusimicrobia bacterium GWA2_56_46]|nr:MAG: CDP-diacylglycerol--glycerol-3-phosphate 3-phosphatidyltransferase [Elusimicrobia bacterium GWA2_56_46]OGR53853.1 MAG: CDP-diacylglycerol--glycerol-3-phosphate 3-phosphatidyltransferase [Elusimicrobia bacterium GWC2_56_31]HBB68324.1 CDP-diacylglycerol--glycerol-3-phosphate 3-phosphatidyltransferase [Elusimicrobiota bacterium]HBW22705.1 CDP-diacylglycerol--glycerol-3-phosphate 3-phosphatidyltransferase [Elusimicrobiota bacterium]